MSSTTESNASHDKNDEDHSEYGTPTDYITTTTTTPSHLNDVSYSGVDTEEGKILNSHILPESHMSVSKPSRKSSRSRSNSVMSSSRLFQQKEYPSSTSMKISQSLQSINTAIRDDANDYRRSSIDSTASSPSSANSVKFVTASINSLLEKNKSNDQFTLGNKEDAENNFNGQSDEEEINLNISKPLLSNIITSHLSLPDLSAANRYKDRRNVLFSPPATDLKNNPLLQANPMNAMSNEKSGSSNNNSRSGSINAPEQINLPNSSKPSVLKHTNGSPKYNITSTANVSTANVSTANTPTAATTTIPLERSKTTTCISTESPLERARTNSNTSGISLVSNTLVQPSPTSSIRPVSVGTNHSFIKPMYLQQQYAINEKQYLKKIKNTKSSQNDYYNRGIFDNSNSSFNIHSFYQKNENANETDLQPSLNGYTEIPTTITNLNTCPTPPITRNENLKMVPLSPKSDHPTESSFKNDYFFNQNVEKNTALDSSPVIQKSIAAQRTSALSTKAGNGASPVVKTKNNISPNESSFAQKPLNLKAKSKQSTKHAHIPTKTTLPLSEDVLKNKMLNKIKDKNVCIIESDYIKELKKYSTFSENDEDFKNGLSFDNNSADIDVTPYRNTELDDYISDQAYPIDGFSQFSGDSNTSTVLPDNLHENDNEIPPTEHKRTKSLSNNLLAILPRSSSPALSARSQSNYAFPIELAADEDDFQMQERLEWQLMLTRVLKGDIVQNEKSKLSELKEQIGGHETDFKNNIWIELKAWMNGHTVPDQIKTLDMLKNSVADDVFQKILNFQFNTEVPCKEGFQQTFQLLDEYYKVVAHWKTLKDMHEEKPVTATKEFQDVVNALTCWRNLSNAFTNLILDILPFTNLNEYLGNEYSLLFAGKTYKDVVNYTLDPEYVDKFIKEEDIEAMFQKKIFFKQVPWIFKAQMVKFRYEEVYSARHIPVDLDRLKLVLFYPFKLIKEIIKKRLEYSKSLVDPTMMIIDQLIDDLCVQIKLATQIKFSVMQSPFFRLDWDDHTSYDEVLQTAVQHVFEMTNLKLASKSTSIFKSSKDIDELLQQWDNFKNLGIFINEKIGLDIASNYAKLFLQMSMKLHIYVLKKCTRVPDFKKEQDLEKWVFESMENVGSVKRKFERFMGKMCGSLVNQANYTFQDENWNTVLENLVASNHTLLYTGGELESYGIYALISKEIVEKGSYKKDDILKILNNSSICSDVVPTINIKNSLHVYGNENIYQIYSEDPESKVYWKTHTENGISYHNLVVGDNNPSTKSFEASNEPKEGVASQKKEETLENIYKGEQGYTDEENEEYEKKRLRQMEETLEQNGYLILLKADSSMLWEGSTIILEEPVLSSEIKLDLQKLLASDNFNLSLLTEGSPYSTDYQMRKFHSRMNEALSLVNTVCSVAPIENMLQKINRVFYKMTTSVLNEYPKTVTKLDQKFPGSEILNNGFMFTRDFARSYLVAHEHQLNQERKAEMVMSIMQLAIEWVGFICDKCNPTDLRTFRWCVPAMEYAMKITSGHNILALSAEQYSDLKRKISGCMSLLISHFDVMGGRARAMAENKYLIAAQQKSAGSQVMLDDYDDDAVLEVNSQMRLQSINELEKQYRKRTKQKKKIGKVLNDFDREDKYLAALASSISNVSIKWRKRQFIGGGSFGDVYSAINLDTGGILAVKQIKIQHSKNMEKIYPRIKDEMNVLEVLNHPNVVQYYGVEVHRDKVNIFMEFCEGGSLASLLEHGRFEDEVITQVYSLQLLEGLAYLHHSGVVHRDIKPENILLDHNGVVKYVDFGAAELISKNGTRKYSSTRSRNGKQNSMMGTPMYMAPENITGRRKGIQLGADDIWSLGCVILEMVTGRRPWANLDNEWAIMYHVAAGHIPQFPTSDEMSGVGTKFLSRLLKHNPDQRATAVELLLDPWIAEIRKIAFSTDDTSGSSSSSSSVLTTPV
ncbi:hypothetical protein ACO0RG_000493 [Hanseniaspora osmophila]